MISENSFMVAITHVYRHWYVLLWLPINNSIIFTYFSLTSYHALLDPFNFFFLFLCYIDKTFKLKTIYVYIPRLIRVLNVKLSGQAAICHRPTKRYPLKACNCATNMQFCDETNVFRVSKVKTRYSSPHNSYASPNCNKQFSAQHNFAKPLCETN